MDIKGGGWEWQDVSVANRVGRRGKEKEQKEEEDKEERMTEGCFRQKSKTHSALSSNQEEETKSLSNVFKTQG